MTGLIDFVTEYSVTELRKERDKWEHLLAEKKLMIERATEEYNQAAITYRLIDTALNLRERQPPQNGHKSNAIFLSAAAHSSVSSSVNQTPSDNDDQADKTALLLETVRRNPGLRPGGIFQSMLEQGIPVRRPYVSTVLMRLKARGQVYADEAGKYFAK